jgi:hypothetical protein
MQRISEALQAYHSKNMIQPNNLYIGRSEYRRLKQYLEGTMPEKERKRGGIRLVVGDKIFGLKLNIVTHFKHLNVTN